MDGFIGEIRMVGYPWAPRNWELCQGAILSISSNSALYSLIGTMYGGDGRSTFQLPDFRGRVPVGWNPNSPALTQNSIGQIGGQEYVTLTTAQMPQHNHGASLSGSFQAIPKYSTDNAARVAPSAGDVPAASKVSPTLGSGDDVKAYGPPANLVDGHAISVSAPSSAITIDNNGGSQSHYNIQPFLVVNYVINLIGQYPMRN